MVDMTLVGTLIAQQRRAPSDPSPQRDHGDQLSSGQFPISNGSIERKWDAGSGRVGLFLNCFNDSF